MIGFVYFARAINGTGPVKIGYSADAIARLPQLAHWCPEPLQLLLAIPGDKKLERNIQNCFFEDHYHHEWFHVSDRLGLSIERLQAGWAVEDAIDLNDIRGNILGKTTEQTRLRNGNLPPWETRKINSQRKRARLAAASNGSESAS